MCRVSGSLPNVAWASMVCASGGSWRGVTQTRYANGRALCVVRGSPAGLTSPVGARRGHRPWLGDVGAAGVRMRNRATAETGQARTPRSRSQATVAWLQWLTSE